VNGNLVFARTELQLYASLDLCAIRENCYHVIDKERLQESSIIKALERQLQETRLSFYNRDSMKQVVKNVVIGLLHKANKPAKVTLLMRYVTTAATWTPSLAVCEQAISIEQQVKQRPEQAISVGKQAIASLRIGDFDRKTSNSSP